MIYIKGNSLRFTCFILLSVVVWLVSCIPKNQSALFCEGETMGTTYHIEYSDSASRNLQSDIDSVLDVVNTLMSTFETETVISRVNQQYPTYSVDIMFTSVFNLAKEIYKKTEGAFDPTVMPLVNAWGFGYKKVNGLPDKRTIDSLMSHVGFDKIIIEEFDYKKFIKYFLKKSDVNAQLDFSGIAKGYGVDIICKHLNSKGINNYMVEIGGEIRTKGMNSKGDIWRIGIDLPNDDVSSKRELKAILGFNDMAIATSGNYRNYFEKDGKKYAHIINPKTGYPEISNLLSVSVLANNCTAADAYATGFMVMGLDKAMNFVLNYSSLEAYFIYSDENGQIRSKYTPGVEAMILEEK